MKNTFINNYRRKSRANKFMTTVDNLLAVRPAKDYKSNNVEMDLYVKEISEKVDNLKDQYKIPFNQFNDGYRYQEIAEELNIPVGTVKSRIFLARQELMKDLKPYSK
jgi:RNA polymerase sigma-70 factor (ECF subfamily)